MATKVKVIKGPVFDHRGPIPTPTLAQLGIRVDSHLVIKSNKQQITLDMNRYVIYYQFQITIKKMLEQLGGLK